MTAQLRVSGSATTYFVVKPVRILAFFICFYLFVNDAGALMPDAKVPFAGSLTPAIWFRRPLRRAPLRCLLARKSTRYECSQMPPRRVLQLFAPARELK